MCVCVCVCVVCVVRERERSREERLRREIVEIGREKSSMFIIFEKS